MLMVLRLLGARDAEEELMKGPLTAQETINNITNETLGGCPTEQREQSTGLAASFPEWAFKSQSTG